MRNAAICLFVYNRPYHTKQVLKSLSDCKNFSKFKLYIFSDNFNKLKKKDKFGVSLVRNEVYKFKKKRKNVLIKFLNTNLGLYGNLTRGISYVLKKHSSVIVLEDDLLLNKSFLNFMYNSLKKFKNKKNIFQISGYSYPFKNNTNNAYFLNLTSCWGWATWSDRWKNFIKFSRNKRLIRKVYDNINSDDRKKHQFNVYGSYNYLRMLKKQITSKFNSWGVLFYLFSFYKKYLNLFPPYSFVANIGFDGSGFHKSTSNVFNQFVNKSTRKRICYPRLNKLDNNNLKLVSTFLFKELSLVRKIINYLFK